VDRWLGSSDTACMREDGQVGEPLADRALTEPHPSRLSEADPMRARILAAHAEALEAGRPGYLDPASGLFVLSAAFLAARATCCRRGCRHCPYVQE
jgi:hypothetical protein